MSFKDTTIYSSNIIIFLLIYLFLYVCLLYPFSTFLRFINNLLFYTLFLFFFFFISRWNSVLTIDTLFFFFLWSVLSQITKLQPKLFLLFVFIQSLYILSSFVFTIFTYHLNVIKAILLFRICWKDTIFFSFSIWIW